MLINLKTKIWLTIGSIVLMFSFFTLFYFPFQQGKLLINNYNTEVQNLANTVALGVKIAITEQNFEGVQTAIEFVKDDSRLQFVSMLQYDTVWNNTHNKFQIKKNVFKTFPENQHPDANVASSDLMIVKRAPFSTSMMSGAILLGFSTKDILESKSKIRLASLTVSSVVFFIGILLGLWLAKNISVPVLALRDAANKVGEGNLDQKITRLNKDEIGELGKAFNKMVAEIATNRTELNHKNKELSTTILTLNNTMLELKNTHAQLIQSEKMASLGELTAGIAHEIQNPLNFVNNFSEVNTELIDELKQEIIKGDLEAIQLLAGDINTNEQKINHHGKRAAAIVKGMLQHSRSSSGLKEPTNLNSLADEYFRLAYHGLRAKDKTFNATMKTDFDNTIGNINIVPQDIGRVILNLITNAFYAVTEKKNKLNSAFEPTVSITTKKEGNSVCITVQDNGSGIPQNILDKIFQPFFTTKPTGQGTGLGLSMSYDIVTKMHRGELKVESKIDEGSKFIINLPV